MLLEAVGIIWNGERDIAESPVLPGESPGEESRRARGGGIRVEAKERKDRLGGRRGSLYL